MEYDLVLFTDTPYSALRALPGFDFLDDSGKLKICKAYSDSDWSLDRVLIAFMNGLTPNVSNLSLGGAVLQVGIFSSVANSIPTLRMSQETIIALSEFDVGIEITIYPCTD